MQTSGASLEMSCGNLMGITALLPLIVAAVIRLVDISGTSQKFLDGFRPLWGAAWYIFGGFISIIYFAKGVRKDVYDHPIIYGTASGREKKIGTHASRKLSVLSVLGACGQDENSKRVSLFGTLRMLGGLGIF